VAKELRRAFAHDLWNVTIETNTIYDVRWKSAARVAVFRFQRDSVANIKAGYPGADPGVRVWTFSSALMYSLTVFTTIGEVINDIQWSLA